ncbi:hypothetical protein D8770_28065 [Methylobacterium sp. DB1607]|nr:hypothetical protein [Methylobacterium sp. DB1607]
MDVVAIKSFFVGLDRLRNLLCKLSIILGKYLYGCSALMALGHRFKEFVRQQVKVGFAAYQHSCHNDAADSYGYALLNANL